MAHVWKLICFPSFAHTYTYAHSFTLDPESGYKWYCFSLSHTFYLLISFHLTFDFTCRFAALYLSFVFKKKIHNSFIVSSHFGQCIAQKLWADLGFRFLAVLFRFSYVVLQLLYALRFFLLAIFICVYWYVILAEHFSLRDYLYTRAPVVNFFSSLPLFISITRTTNTYAHLHYFHHSLALAINT